jgi:hypothetical protein
VTTISLRSEAFARGARMLRTALGPAISAYLEDPSIIEVMLNPDGRLWIDRLSGGLEDTGCRVTPADAERIVRLVAHHVGVEVHANSPRVSAELPESGERFEGLVPPVAAAPCFAIRRPAVAVFTLGDYVDAGIMSEAQAELLRAAVLERKNILVAGGTSTGKTTLVNALLAEVAKPASCNAPRRTSWRSAPRMAPPRCPISSARLFGSGPIASRSVKCAGPRRWISSRPGAPATPAVSARCTPARPSARCAASNSSSRKPSSRSRAP